MWAAEFIPGTRPRLVIDTFLFDVGKSYKIVCRRIRPISNDEGILTYVERVL